MSLPPVHTIEPLRPPASPPTWSATAHSHAPTSSNSQPGHSLSARSGARSLTQVCVIMMPVHTTEPLRPPASHQHGLRPHDLIAAVTGSGNKRSPCTAEYFLSPARRGGTVSTVTCEHSLLKLEVGVSLALRNAHSMVASPGELVAFLIFLQTRWQLGDFPLHMAPGYTSVELWNPVWIHLALVQGDHGVPQVVLRPCHWTADNSVTARNRDMPS
jgi:hypothetical protein